MEDIFVSAKSGNRASIKGLYASSVESAYAAVSAAVGEGEEAAEIVQQAYVAALGSAQSYEEFFLLLHKRASSACALALNKNVSLAPIEATHSAFDATEQMEIPEALKHFDEPLANVITDAAMQKKPPKKLFDFKKKKKGEKKDELQKFEELVKKREFSGFDSYTPPEPPPEPSKPQKLAEKLQAEEIVLSDEQVEFRKKESLKNRRTSIIAFVLSTIILAGAVSTYFITKHIFTKKVERTPSSQELLEEYGLDKTYTDEQLNEAYYDYLNEVMLKQYGLASTEKVVAYSENGNVGSERLNGIISYYIEDIDGDKQKDLNVIVSQVSYDKDNMYTYAFKLFIYAFKGGKVVPLKEDYPLITYQAYNKGLDYRLDNFKMYVKRIKKDGNRYIYAEAASEDVKICSFHYFENFDMYEAERFVYFAWNEHNAIFMQRHVDGTYEPVCLMVQDEYVSSTDGLLEEYQKTLGEYGYRLSGESVSCTSSSAFKTYFNKAFARIGLKLKSWNMSFFAADKEGYICLLEAEVHKGDMLSHKNVAGLSDYTDLSDYLETPPAEREEAAPEEEESGEEEKTTAHAE